jgi:hypothetical protein
MALTLEAALVLPLSISLVIGLTGAAQPLYRLARQTADLSVQATIFQLEPQHLYQVISLQDGSLAMPALQTSPQRLIEWLQLFRENRDLLGIKADEGKAP